MFSISLFWEILIHFSRQAVILVKNKDVSKVVRKIYIKI